MKVESHIAAFVVMKSLYTFSILGSFLLAAIVCPNVFIYDDFTGNLAGWTLGWTWGVSDGLVFEGAWVVHEPSVVALIFGCVASGFAFRRPDNPFEYLSFDLKP